MAIEAGGIDYAARCTRAQAAMERNGLDVIFVGPGSDMRYLIGTAGIDNERMMLLALPQSSDPVMIVPALEATATRPFATFFDILAWTDAEGSGGAVREMLARFGLASDSTINAAVGAHLWSMFLIALQKALPAARWTTATATLAELRAIKSDEELALLAESGRIADAAFAALVRTVRFAGRTEREVEIDLSALLLKHGHERVEFCLVASGAAGAEPHHHTSDKIIEPGEAVVLDFGGSYKDYASDTTRTVLVRGGTPDPDFARVHRIVEEAQQRAYEAVQPGVAAEALDAEARHVIVEEGFGDYFVHRLGHGIGLDVHEDPYLVGGNAQPMRAGNAFSIEPGIYIPGRFGVRIEDIAAIMPDGTPARFNNSERGIVEVD